MSNFDKCRVCTCSVVATVGSYDMCKLPVLAHKFVTCTDLTVSAEEGVPTKLCQDCFDQLEQLYAFRAKCIAADTKWRMQILAFCDDEEPEYNLGTASNTVKAAESELDCETQNTTNERMPTYSQHSAYTEVSIEILASPTTQLEENVGNDQSCFLEHPKNIFKCDTCGAQFLDEQRLLTHKRRHGQMPYPCTEPGCDRGYSHKHTLTLHMRKCHRLGKEHKLHICEFCGKVFDTMAQLRNHRFTHKDKSELPYACDEPNCKRRFSSKQLLKVHMLRHAGIKNYTCSYCGVQKTTRTELKIHLNYHTLERTYCCRFCSKVCYSSSNLNKHMRTIHERARNYACSYCDLTFTQPAIRKQHELIHTGEKPHECTECGRHFRQKAALRTHYKVHNRQRQESDLSVLTVAITAVDGDKDVTDYTLNIKEQ